MSAAACGLLMSEVYLADRHKLFSQINLAHAPFANLFLNAVVGYCQRGVPFCFARTMPLETEKGVNE